MEIMVTKFRHNMLQIFQSFKQRILVGFFFTLWSELKQVIVEKMVIVGIPFPQQQL